MCFWEKLPPRVTTSGGTAQRTPPHAHPPSPRQARASLRHMGHVSGQTDGRARLVDRTSNDTDNNSPPLPRAHPVPCEVSPNRADGGFPTGQRGNPGSGGGSAPRTPARGSPSVQIPQAWARLAPAEEGRQPRSLHWKLWERTHPVGMPGSGRRVGRSRREGDGGGGGLCPRRGEDSALPPLSPFPPCWCCILGSCSHNGRQEAGGGRSTVQGKRRPGACPEVPPFPHPPCSYPCHGAPSVTTQLCY